MDPPDGWLATAPSLGLRVTGTAFSACKAPLDENVYEFGHAAHRWTFKELQKEFEKSRLGAKANFSHHIIDLTKNNALYLPEVLFTSEIKSYRNLYSTQLKFFSKDATKYGFIHHKIMIEGKSVPSDEKYNELFFDFTHLIDGFKNRKILDFFFQNLKK